MSQSSSADRVSAAICTRNRPDKIGTAVASVLANDFPGLQLTVIDQSTDGQTESIMATLAKDEPRLRYVRVAETGLSRAYNRAIENTSGEMIAFTDDDCVVPTDWIANVVAAFDANPDVDLLYGRVIPLVDTLEDLTLTPYLDIAKPERLSKRDGFRVFGMGANFAARRRLFDNIGPFDVVLGGGGLLKSSQDFDLAYRAYRSGSVILLDPDVVLRHDGRREHDDWPSLLTNYGVGDGGFYAKHVRCRDLYALSLLIRQVVSKGGRRFVKRVLGRASGRDVYVRSMLRGVRESFRYKVDRSRRLYVEPSGKS